MEAYVAEHVLAQARLGALGTVQLTDSELRASLAICDEGMAQAGAGEGLRVDESLARNRDRLRSQQS